MAGRKLTDEEKAHYNMRMAMNRAAKQKEAAAKSGIDTSKVSTNTRSAEQIMSDIEKVKQDPKFQAKWQKYLDTKASQGTQADHHVTDSKNHTKTVKGGSLGGGALGIGEFIEQIK